MRTQGAKSFAEVGNADRSRSFPRDEEDVLKALIAEKTGLGEDFRGGKSLAGNVVAHAEPTVVADVLALVGKVEGGKEANGIAEALPSKLVAKASHGLQIAGRRRRNQRSKILESTRSTSGKGAFHLIGSDGAYGGSSLVP